MKYSFCPTITLALASLIYPSTPQAQNNSLQNRAILENVNRLQGQLNDLLQSYNALKKELDTLKAEVRRTHAETLKNKPNTLTQNDIDGLAKTIREVDRKRSADKELILKEIRSIANNSARSRPSPVQPNKPASPQKGFDHSVQSGETISAIISAYNEQLKSEGVKDRITLKSVLKANPKLNPRSIQIGQNLFIPDPR
ncbi:MAG: LysM domain-containing protein [Verrucomicrobiota bacterium]|nr:LysM domain-containing protein [Verrucomicrobiota bacterium]